MNKYNSFGVLCSFTFIYLITKYCYCNKKELEPDQEPANIPQVIMDDLVITSQPVAGNIIKTTPILFN